MKRKLMRGMTPDMYIRMFPADVRVRLALLRRTIKKAAPKATERISYQLVSFVFHGNLVYFGGFKDHIGFYPASGVTEYLRREVAPYRTSKGTLQFKAGTPLPLALIRKIVKLRMKENLALEKERTEKKKKRGGKR